jgi:hypothetical protein
MDYCHVCDKPKEELVKCEECGQDVCLGCLTERTPHNLIDFNLCKTCYENLYE